MVCCYLFAENSVGDLDHVCWALLFHRDNGNLKWNNRNIVVVSKEKLLCNCRGGGNWRDRAFGIF